MKVRLTTRRPSATRDAFTLIELVISAGLMAIILASAYLCLHSGLLTQKLVEDRGEMMQTARIALHLMAADLRAACPLSKDVEFVGLDREVHGVEADNVDFGTHHYRPQRDGEGDFCQMSYFVAQVPDADQFALWRRRNPRFGPNPLAGGQREELLRGIRGLKLEYYDGLDWHDEWGDATGRSKAQFSNREDRRRTLQGLPDAVRITLWVSNATPPASNPGPGAEPTAPPTEPPLKFQTVARLHLADRPTGDSNRSAGSNEPSTTPQSNPADTGPGGNP
jgi:hypothetical protein